MKVVELNPAWHFTLDSKGEKVSIVAPKGWEMLSDMGVTRAQNSVNGDGRSENGDLGKGYLAWAQQDCG